MWPRTLEVMLAGWLAMSPFIFRHPIDAPQLWWNDFGCAALIAAASLCAFWGCARRAHLLNVLIAFWLLGFSYLSIADPASPAAQNGIVVGLILLMLAIIPSESTLPPKPWRQVE